MKVVILCGGKGTRLYGHSSGHPKPLVEIGDVPILCHIMSIYAHYGFNYFVLCLGFKAEAFREYFASRQIGEDTYRPVIPGQSDSDAVCGEWRIAFADTGPDTNTGGRIKRIEPLIDDQTFLATYGDGLADIDLNELLSFHDGKECIATITCVNPLSPFGIVNMDADNRITGFVEKPVIKDWVNGGFFVFERKIFEYLGDNDILERAPFEHLVADGEMAGKPFHGFWQCMDSYKDHQQLTGMWEAGDAPWCVWNKTDKRQ